jgi:tetratricopeptide (TPR) repeat protein
MKKARERFLGLLMKEKENFYLLYYLALSDYRLTNYFIINGKMEEAEVYVQEGQAYLEKAIEIDPECGELYALKASLMGFDIALHQDRAMSLGLQIFQNFTMAFQKSPDNPRVCFLKGVSDLYTPAQWGGGPDPALKNLIRAAELFDGQDTSNPVRPSWGYEETHTFMAMAYLQKREINLAREHFKRALEINPDYALAKDELKKLGQQ